MHFFRLSKQREPSHKQAPRALPQGKRDDAWEMPWRTSPAPFRSAEIARPVFQRTMTMFDAQIALALFAAFLLGVVAGSGMEIIVRAGRH